MEGASRMAIPVTAALTGFCGLLPGGAPLTCLTQGVLAGALH